MNMDYQMLSITRGTLITYASMALIALEDEVKGHGDQDAILSIIADLKIKFQGAGVTKSELDSVQKDRI